MEVQRSTLIDHPLPIRIACRWLDGRGKGEFPPASVLSSQTSSRPTFMHLLPLVVFASPFCQVSHHRHLGCEAISHPGPHQSLTPLFLLIYLAWDGPKNPIGSLPGREHTEMFHLLQLCRSISSIYDTS
jgi:hypothetical protein